MTWIRGSGGCESSEVEMRSATTALCNTTLIDPNHANMPTNATVTELRLIKINDWNNGSLMKYHAIILI